jgi:hypothetical protein
MAEAVKRGPGRPPKEPKTSGPVSRPPVVREPLAHARRAEPEPASATDERSEPQRRLDALKRKGTQNLGEGEMIQLRRLEYLIRDEKRVEELLAMQTRVPEEEDELTMLRQRVREARVNGGFEADD